MRPVSQAITEQGFPENKFWLGVLWLDLGHEPRSLLACICVESSPACCFHIESLTQSVRIGNVKVDAPTGYATNALGRSVVGLAHTGFQWKTLECFRTKSIKKPSIPAVIKIYLEFMGTSGGGGSGIRTRVTFR